MRRRTMLSIMMIVPAFAATSAPAQTQNTQPAPATRPRTVTPQTLPTQPTTPDASTTPAQPQQQRPQTRQTPTPAPAAPQPATRTIVQPVTSAPQNLPAPSSALPPESDSTQQSNATVSTAQGAPLKLSAQKARARILEAQRLLKSRPMQTAFTTPALYTVTLAALDPSTSLIHLLTLPKDTFLTKGAELSLTTSLGVPVQLRILRANGVNTAVTIFDNMGRSLTPLIVEFPTERNGVFRELAYYTSAHPALLSPDIIRAGQTYVHTMIDLAAKRLKEKGTTIAPKILDVAERLCLVEHVDHDRFRKENRVALYEEIYSLYALNELDTYRYSVSVAGAGGMVQMIPWTYQMIRQRHPGAGLNPDFVAGMRNHGNALEAMLLYMQDTWADLSLDPDVTNALATGLATQTELLAAGYNSNPAKLPLYLRRGGADWRTLIPRETQMYLQIYRSLDALMPMKTRS